MHGTEEAAKNLSGLDAKISDLEAEIAPLRKVVEDAEAEVHGHSQSLTEAQAELATAEGEYRAECRKLASGRKSNAVECKLRAHEVGARVEGLQMLLADAESAAQAAREQIAAPERDLDSARHQRDVAAEELRIAEALARVADKRRSLEQEVAAALQEIEGPHVAFEIRSQHSFYMEGSRLRRLSDFLGQPMFRAS
ncbi:MAG TPA: hypothetical protein VFZ27_17420 [Terriglobia bacterium]|nr:hypothetical protein [Terriglobia bacterium]